MQLRKALKEYNDAIIQYCQISKLPTADPQELEKFQSWLSQPGLGGVYLLGRDRDVWSQGRDLMTLTLSPHTNRFSRFVANKAFPLYHRLRHSTAMGKIYGYLFKSHNSVTATSADTGIATYDDAHLISASEFISLVGIFSALFSSALWFMNDGELVEVFGATSAFAAVQVVFIGISST